MKKNKVYKGLIKTRKKLIADSEKVMGVADLSDKDKTTFYIYRIIFYVILFISLIGSGLMIYFRDNNIMYKIINLIAIGFISFDMISLQYQLSNNIIMKLFFNKNKKRKKIRSQLEMIKLCLWDNFSFPIFFIITIVLLYYKGFNKDFLLLFLLILLYFRAFFRILDQIIGGYFAKKGRVDAFFTIFLATILTIALKIGLNKNYILIILFTEICIKMYKIIKNRKYHNLSKKEK